MEEAADAATAGAAAGIVAATGTAAVVGTMMVVVAATAPETNETTICHLWRPCCMSSIWYFKRLLCLQFCLLCRTVNFEVFTYLYTETKAAAAS